jgi:hypothetical protein
MSWRTTRPLQPRLPCRSAPKYSFPRGLDCRPTRQAYRELGEYRHLRASVKRKNPAPRAPGRLPAGQIVWHDKSQV